MLSTIVDNSTLTAVQRLIGDIGVARSFPMEGDVSAFDNYLQSLLLYDEIASIDDYKEEHKSSRHERFLEVRFISPQRFEYEDISCQASKAAEEIHFQIQRGKLSKDPMAEFLRSLNLHVCPAWYMQSSEWFLRLRLLADDAEVNLPKYGALMSVIRGQLSESFRSYQDATEKFSIENSKGMEIDHRAKGDGSIAKEIADFAKGLNWMSYRSLFYMEAAHRMDCAFTLHPVRHSFLAQYSAKKMMPSSSSNLRKNFLNFFSKEIKEIKQTSDEQLGDGLARIDLPFFAAWAVGFAGNPRNGYDHVLQIRDGAEARRLRSHFREIEAMHSDVNSKSQRILISKLYAAVQQDIKFLRSKFGGDRLPMSADVSVDLMTLSPSLSFSGIFSGVMRHLPRSSQKLVTVLRSISRDITMIPTLGQISDQFLHSRMIRAGTPFVPESPRMESKKYERASSHWKRPL